MNVHEVVMVSGYDGLADYDNWPQQLGAYDEKNTCGTYLNYCLNLGSGIGFWLRHGGPGNLQD